MSSGYNLGKRVLLRTLSKKHEFKTLIMNHIQIAVVFLYSCIFFQHTSYLSDLLLFR